MAPSFKELRIRRPGWFAQIVRYPGRHEQILTALFGAIPTDDRQQSDDMGRLTAYANPWARQFHADLEALQCVEEGEALLAKLQGSIMALWRGHHPFVCKIDFTILRRRLHAVSFAPPEYVDNYLE
eukprot:8863593-Pyramimonas_sp.AAC.1